jgi:putative MATE family efflux protein
MAEFPMEFEKGDIVRHLLYLSVPLLIVNLMQNFFSVFDMFLLGKLGVHAQSAISIIGFILSTFWSMQGGLGAGAMAIASRCCGKKDYGELKKTMVNTLFAAYALTLIYVIIAFIFRDRLLTYFGAKGETLELAKYIFTTCLISVLNDSGLWIFFAVLRASGQIKRHFYLLVVSIILNTILEPVLIFGWMGFPKLGLMGAPMARFISYFTTTFVMIFILTNTSGVLRIDWKKIGLDWKFLANYIKISIPAMMQGLLSNLASLVMLKIAAPAGDALLATLGITSRLDVFVMMIGWAIGGSTSVLVGHNLGAGDVKRAKDSVITSLKIYTGFTFACFLIYFNFSEWVIKIFNSDPAVVHYGVTYLKIVPFFYLFMGVGIITANAFNGAGETKTPMVINLVAFFALQIPVVILLSRIPAIAEKGIFIAIASVFLFQGIAGWITYKQGGWIGKKVAARV